jgi:transketolase
VGRDERRHYGTPAQHQAAHGLDAASLRERIAGFITASRDSGRGRVPARSLA